MELKTSIEELKQSLLESEAFVRYQKVRAEVHNYPEKEYRLHEFRRKNYFLQNSREQLDLFTEEDRLEQEYADFTRIHFWESIWQRKWQSAALSSK